MTLHVAFSPFDGHRFEARCDCGTTHRAAAAPAAFLAELGRIGWRDGRCGTCAARADREGGR